MKISFDSNKGSAASALDYAENGMDSKKVLRAEPPEWLGGMPLELFRGTGRDVVAIGTNGLATFSLGYEECPPLDVRHRVFNIVIAFLGAGLEPWDLAHTGVAHWKAEPATGRLSPLTARVFSRENGAHSSGEINSNRACYSTMLDTNKGTLVDCRRRPSFCPLKRYLLRSKGFDGYGL